MAGDDAHPAIPGYDPDISAELNTTNGETTEHAYIAYGTVGFTPDMSTARRPARRIRTTNSIRLIASRHDRLVEPVAAVLKDVIANLAPRALPS